jgi:hypothetical protein
MWRRTIQIPAILLGAYLISALSFMPLSALGFGMGRNAQVPRECYYLLPVTLLGAGLYILTIRIARHAVNLGHMVIVMLLIAVPALLLFHSGIFYAVVGDAFLAYAAYGTLCSISYLVVCTLLVGLLLKMVVSRESRLRGLSCE